MLARLGLVISLFVASPSFSAKTDVVEMLNGDHITGEIKSLERGLLQFKTDHMGTVSIEWDDIAWIKSDQLLEVESTEGVRWFGQIGSNGGPGELAIAIEDGSSQAVPLADTVRIAPLDEGGDLHDRFDGYLDFGFSDAKATEVTQLSFDAGFSYRSRENLWQLDLTTMQSDSSSAKSISTTVSGMRQHFFGNRWYWSGLLQLDRNDELGLDLRSMFGGTVGRYFVQTNSQKFGMGTGLAVSREELHDGQEIDSLEVILGMTYEAFRFDDPQLDLSTQLVIFPSLSVSGRVRGQARIRFRYEIINDLFAELTFTEAFDSKPQSVGAEKDDYTITTSIGYTF